MRGIFGGLKVLDLSWVIVGPTTTKYLADQGATVIKVENLEHPCILRSSPPYRDRVSGINRSGYFAQHNTNKLSLGLDIQRPEGKGLLKKLVQWSDILVESFSPGVMEKVGLSYEVLSKIKPGLIYIHTSMLGHSGPHAHLRGFGFHLVGYAGFTHITGWPDRAPSPPYGPYTDTIAPRYITTVLILALLRKRKTGKGAYIDVSQYEAGLQFLAPLLLDYQINGRIKGRDGNSHTFYCPHQVYPCKGEDSWIAIAITNEGEWETLRGIIGGVWDEKFSTYVGRISNEAELDELISSWTIKYTSEEIMELLQKEGVPSGIVKNPRELLDDSQLLYRDAFWKLNHDETIGESLAFGQPFILSKSPYVAPKPAPRLGEHTYYVCHDILGMRDEEISRLLEKEILQIT